MPVAFVRLAAFAPVFGPLPWLGCGLALPCVGCLGCRLGCAHSVGMACNHWPSAEGSRCCAGRSPKVVVMVCSFPLCLTIGTGAGVINFSFVRFGETLVVDRSSVLCHSMSPPPAQFFWVSLLAPAYLIGPPFAGCLRCRPGCVHLVGLPP